MKLHCILGGNYKSDFDIELRSAKYSFDMTVSLKIIAVVIKLFIYSVVFMVRFSDVFRE